MAEQIKNSATSTLSVGIGSGDASLSVQTGQGANFPTSGNFRLVVDNEIMLCTARTGDTLTVTRAQEGTAAAAHVAGASVVHILTAGGLTQYISDQVALNGISKPNPIQANDVPVWSGSAWVRPSGTPSSSVFLRGDGTWQVPPGSSPSSRLSSLAELHPSAGQTVTTSSTTLVAADASGVNTDGYVFPTGGVYQIQVPRTGYYRITGAYQWASNTAGFREMYFTHYNSSGAQIATSIGVQDSVATNAFGTNQTSSAIRYMLTNERIAMFVWQNSGASITQSAGGSLSGNYFAIEFLGA